MKIVLGTYNVQHCNDYTVTPDYSKPDVNVKKVAEILKYYNYDIVGLNEVYSKGNNYRLCNQTEKIADKLGTDQYVFALGKDNSDWAIGNSVISRFTILSSEVYNVFAPSEQERPKNQKDWYEDRVILKTVIDIGRPICFISTHFGLNNCEKEKMVNKLIEVVDSVDLPCVLCGDFNSTPDSEFLKPFYDRFTSVAEQTDKKYISTFSSFDPSVTIDYVFVSKEFKILDYQSLDVLLSDHRPLRVEVEL